MTCIWAIIQPNDLVTLRFRHIEYCEMFEQSWLLFAVLSAGVYAVTNFIDKYILEREVKDYRGLTVYSSIVGLLFGCVYWVADGFQLLTPQDTFLIILSGVFTVWGLAAYFRSLSSEETSTVIFFMQMTPVITLLLSALFIGERISTLQFYGFILVLFAMMGMSFSVKKLRIRCSVAFACILLADSLWAGANVLFKFVIAETTFNQLIAYESFGIALGGFLLYLAFPSVKKAFQAIRLSTGRSVVLFILLNEAIFIAAKLLGFYAISLGPVSLVSVVGSTQVFFGIAYGLLLTLFTRKVYHENISPSGMMKKFSLALLVFAGIWLMQY